MKFFKNSWVPNNRSCLSNIVFNFSALGPLMFMLLRATGIILSLQILFNNMHGFIIDLTACRTTPSLWKWWQHKWDFSLGSRSQTAQDGWVRFIRETVWLLLPPVWMDTLTWSCYGEQRLSSVQLSLKMGVTPLVSAFPSKEPESMGSSRLF